MRFSRNYSHPPTASLISPSLLPRPTERGLYAVGQALVPMDASLMPNVTVLMPVYNAERYLRAAMDSILTQTFSDFEFLIMNDTSTDASRSIITSYRDARIRLIDNEQNLGLTRTLNKGLRVCAGNYVARHDADDIACPERLALQIAFLEEHKDVGLLGTQ